MGKFKWVAPVAVTAAAIFAASALAITYGQPDNGAHPNVGALIAQSSTGLKVYCSGSLIAPRVFLTAAHCVEPALSHGIGDAYVTFDTHADPATSTLLHGVIHTDSLYTGKSNDTNDFAVILLDKPVNGITPVALPAAGYLDTIPKTELGGLSFVDVGYGVHEPGVAWDSSRWFAVSGDAKLRDGGWLALSQKASKGFGGTCTGDSGGPELLGNVQVAITIKGDPMCKSSNLDLRLDTAAARDFLAQFVALP